MSGLTHAARDVGADPMKCPCCGRSFSTTKMLQALFMAILRRIKDGDRVIVHNFGTFLPTVLKGREVRTPIMKGGKTRFEDRVVIRFRQSTVAKKYLNKQPELKRAKKGASGE